MSTSIDWARELAADEGDFAVEEIGSLQELDVRTVIADPKSGRRRPDLPPDQKTVLNRALRAVKSKSGKALLRRRGEHLERSFAHVLDHGGCRRATLRGTANLTKRYLTAVLTHNLSILMRKLHKCGTPKQWVAGGAVFLALIRLYTERAFAQVSSLFFPTRESRTGSTLSLPNPLAQLQPPISTGC